MIDAEVQPKVSRWDRFRGTMFRMLVPGLALPVLAAVSISLIRDSCQCDDSYGINRIPTVTAITLLMFLLGSMALRAWNHGHDVRNTAIGRLPSLAAVVHGLTYALLILWPLAIVSRLVWDDVLLNVFGGALALLAVLDQSSIIGRWEGRRPATEVTGPS